MGIFTPQPPNDAEEHQTTPEPLKTLRDDPRSLPECFTPPPSKKKSRHEGGPSPGKEEINEGVDHSFSSDFSFSCRLAMCQRRYKAIRHIPIPTIPPWLVTSIDPKKNTIIRMRSSWFS